MNPIDVDVAICGAGPAGAALAHVLSDRGVRVALVERHTDLDREFRGEWLSPSGQTALRDLGLGDALDE